MDRPRVDFYLTGDPDPAAAGMVACRIAEKAWQAGHTVYLHTTGPAEAARLNDLLWTFRQESFVPHGRYPARPEDRLPVLIGAGEDPGDFGEVLINLTESVPAFHQRFIRVAEVVPAGPDRREAARGRYRYYRERGYALGQHEV